MSASVTFLQFKSEFNLYKNLVKKISADEIQVLWYMDFYDGMLSGMVRYEEQDCLAETITDYTQAIRPRVFAVLQLTEEQIKEANYWHSLFEKHVDFGRKPQSEHHLFYESYQRRGDLNYEMNSVIAWYLEADK
ncbi:MAG TPA: hypothetical protein VMR70_14180 [Flavisolibacter sp.]|nr:hypothetical protein [Flavisolibacter sp.]